MLKRGEKMKKLSVVLVAAIALNLIFSVPGIGCFEVLADTVSENTVSNNSASKETNKAVVNTTEEDEEEEDDLKESREKLKALADQYPILVLVYHITTANLVDVPGGSNVTGSINMGEQASVKDFGIDEAGRIWYLVEAVNGATGYIEGQYIVTNDTRFNEWEESELSSRAGDYLATETTVDDLRWFPEGYRAALTQLLQAHPNWTFVPYTTGIQWNEAVANERVGVKSLVHANASDSWKSKDEGDYDQATGTYIVKSGTSWYRASEMGVGYCMNPMNYLDEDHIFAFEQLAYVGGKNDDANAIRSIINGTFVQGLEGTFVTAGQQSGVSPIHLSSRVIQEQGRAGSGQLANGSLGYYNLFNIEASGTAAQIVARGLACAQRNNWTTKESSIIGGAHFLGQNYINVGQNTVYFQKFNVTTVNRYNHQYMQNIQAPMSESVSTARAYRNAGIINAPHVFAIPIYYNTPAASGEVAEKFVTNLYNVILDREPDADGLRGWTDALMQGYTACDLIYGFFNSDEMRNKNLTNELFVAYAYAAILGRAPDEAGRQAWVNELNLGVSRNTIIKGFAESPEFTAQCSAYGIERGMYTKLAPMDLNPGQTKFVTRLYKNILLRGADDTGLNGWTKALQDGATGCQIVEGFVYSDEFLGRNYSDEEYVEIMYNTILGRGSDAAGKAAWVQVCRQQGRQKCLAGFVYSPEFFILCNDYGIGVGTLTRQ